MKTAKRSIFAPRLLGCALAILPEHRGKGLDAELVFEFASGFGVLPTWFLDFPAYSPAGLGAHRRAWYLGRNADFVGMKAGLAPFTSRAASRCGWDGGVAGFDTVGLGVAGDAGEAAGYSGDAAREALGYQSGPCRTMRTQNGVAPAVACQNGVWARAIYSSQPGRGRK